MDTKEVLTYLESRNPQERVLGIGLLMKHHHPEALEILEALSDNEEDPRAKAVASGAIQSLRQERASIEFDLLAKPRPRSKIAKDGKGKQLNEDSHAKARRMMHRAVAAMEMVDYMQAQDLAYQAFQLDPDMRHDESYMQEAAEIFGTSKQGVLVLLFPNTSVLKNKSKRKSKSLRHGLFSLAQRFISFLE